MGKFSAPSTAAGIKWDDLKGALIVVEALSQERDIPTQYGDSDAVRANVTVVDGPLAGTKYNDTLIFPKVLQSNVRGSIGGDPVLGRVGQGTAKRGQSAPWLIVEATPDDFKVADAAFGGSAGDDEPPF